MEHRWGQRHKVILRIRLSRPGQRPVPAWLSDISLSGAYLRIAGPLPVMGAIHIDLDVRSSGHTAARPLQLQGRVVRHGPAGVGVEWQDFSAATLVEIIRIAALAERMDVDLAREAVANRSPWALGYGEMSDGTLGGIAP